VASASASSNGKNVHTVSLPAFEESGRFLKQIFHKKRSRPFLWTKQFYCLAASLPQKDNAILSYTRHFIAVRIKRGTFFPCHHVSILVKQIKFRKLLHVGNHPGSVRQFCKFLLESQSNEASDPTTQNRCWLLLRRHRGCPGTRHRQSAWLRKVWNCSKKQHPKPTPSSGHCMA
jgi:hypothetical protein